MSLQRSDHAPLLPGLQRRGNSATAPAVRQRPFGRGVGGERSRGGWRHGGRVASRQGDRPGAARGLRCARELRVCRDAILPGPLLPEPAAKRAPAQPPVHSGGHDPDCAPARNQGPAARRRTGVAVVPRDARVGGRAPWVPAGRHADVRGHRALRARRRVGHRHRRQGDVHLHRPGRPIDDAAARGDGAGVARGARSPARAAAPPRPAPLRHADVPLRPSPGGALPAVPPGGHRGDRRPRPVLRRRGDRGGVAVHGGAAHRGCRPAGQHSRRP